MSDKIRFVRIKGRIVPLRSKKESTPTQERIERTITTGIAGGFGVGSATYGALHKQEKKFRATAGRMADIMNRSGAKIQAFVKAPKPDLFQQAAYKKISAANKIHKFRALKQEMALRHTKAVIQTIAKYKFKAAIGAGLAAGIGLAAAAYWGGGKAQK